MSVAAFMVFNFLSCKKDKLITSSDAKLEFSQDSVLFDTVFTSRGSATQNIRIRNKHSQKIRISSIRLEGGSASNFIINVDGAKGTSFSDIEIAANDSMYIFIQVYIDPNNANMPLIVTDAIDFEVNGNQQKVVLEAWGQDAYYHYPTNAINFQDGSYLAYSIVDSLRGSFTRRGDVIVWKNDKPHVIYGYCVVDSLEKLEIPAGTNVFMNYKAGLWVYSGGQIQVLGQKNREVTFQSARREKDYADEPGQWDRIWINEGSMDNIIDYAVIKNGYIGVQAELAGNDFTVPRYLTITNTKIQNMSMWGIYGLAYYIYGGNNVVSNCQEYCANLTMGGSYKFYQCTFANFWGQDVARDKPRDKSTVRVNNYSVDADNVVTQVLPDTAYFGNCIIDGALDNEIEIDLKSGATGTTAISPGLSFYSCWLKTTADTSNVNRYRFVRKGTALKYKDRTHYVFQTSGENQIRNFTNPQAQSDAMRFPRDLNNVSRNLVNVTIGAYEE